MNEYSQPDFYRFNQDSLDLVNWAQRFVPQATGLLDLCAGCGVVGIEYARRAPVEKVTFVELQHEFIPHLEQNRALLPTTTTSEIVNRTFAGWEPGERFDLVLCNPPYYLEGHGEAAQDERRQASRSMAPVNWKLLVMLAENALMPKGNAFFITRNERPVRDTLEAALTGVRLQTSIDLVGKNVILRLRKI